jgi:hypothetical protein
VPDRGLRGHEDRPKVHRHRPVEVLQAGPVDRGGLVGAPDVGEGHVRALVSEPIDDRGADASAAGGDERACSRVECS